MARDDYYASPFGVVYSTYMERPRLSRAISRIVFGGDTKAYYESMAAVGEVPVGGTVVDCPCGAGPALRAVPAGRNVRYVAADLSPSMIRRARKNAARRGLTDVEFIETNATSIPLPDRSVDLFLSLWGLHCYADPAAAMMEAARLLKPSGRLVAASFVAGCDEFRQRLLIRSNRGDFGRVGTQGEIEGWLGAAGFDLCRAERSGPLLFLDAQSSLPQGDRATVAD